MLEMFRMRRLVTLGRTFIPIAWWQLNIRFASAMGRVGFTENGSRWQDFHTPRRRGELQRAIPNAGQCAACWILHCELSWGSLGESPRALVTQMS